MNIHETHVCRDCGAEITLPYVAPSPNAPGLPDPEMLRRMLPGIDALLVIDAVDAGRVIAGRPEVWVVIAAFLRAALAAQSEEPTDTGSEYGRLLAERDRLVSEGADPADLLTPNPPAQSKEPTVSTAQLDWEDRNL